MRRIPQLLFVQALCLLSLFHQSSAQSYKKSLDSISKITDPFLQESIVLRLKEKYPQDSFEPYYYSLSYNFAKAKNMAKASTYLNQLQGKLREMAAESVLKLTMRDDLPAAETLVNQELKRSGQSVYGRLNLLELKTQIMERKGDFKNAYIAMKVYYEATEKKTPFLTAKYYSLMSKSGRYKEAFPELEKAVSAGIANEDIKTELKIAYSKINPQGDVNTYFTSVVKSFEDRYKEAAIAKMINRKANNFTVTDVNGKLISLSDLKGKIVVLDFWATWCVPCVRSLPAMQMAVDKYKDDPSVKFLFIHTLESSTNQKEGAMKYLADNNFNLPLYIDTKTADGKNSATSAFGVLAIPAKFVIDREGQLRFIGFGDDQSDESLVNELSAMIALCRTK
jgi:peroxiredoxin